MPYAKRITLAAVPDFVHRRDLLCTKMGDPDLFYSDHAADQDRARRICQRCPAQPDCLRFALDNDRSWGVWAGYDPEERRAIVDEMERRRRIGAAEVVLPDPPTPVGTPWTWAGAKRSTSPGPVFVAAREVIAGSKQCRAAARAGVDVDLVAAGTVILRWAPQLADDICAGLIPLKTAARYARQVRDAYTATGKAAA